MTLLAPIWLVAGVLAALGAIALHFIARQRPAPMDLPTARFIPDLPARAASRARRPTDLVLLLLRVAAVLLLGLAFAGPILHPERSPLVRVVLLDRSASVASPDSAASVTRANLRDGDVLVTFDTTATIGTWALGDSISPPRQATGDIAAALLTGFAAAREASRRADSIEIVLISPLDASAWTPAVLAVRSRWSGPIRVERMPAAPLDSTGEAVAIRSQPDDPLTATLALMGNATVSGTAVRIVRDTLTPSDTTWARDSGGAIVSWPAASLADTVRENSGAVYARDVVAVAPWVRLGTPGGRAIAWWVDGTPAAAESALGAGCVRDVRVGIPPLGDVALATSTQRLVRALTGPCGESRMGPVPDSLVTRLAAGDTVASTVRVTRAGVMVSPATPWLLAASLLLLFIEWFARGRLGRR